MSKGYYAIKPIVFHNMDSREKFLESHPFYIAVTRLEIFKLYKKKRIKHVYCETCHEVHTKDRVYSSANKLKENII